MFSNLNDSYRDKYIYRIISLERLLELFFTGKNTLVKPERWEDTFENFILKSKVKLLSGEIIEYDIHQRIFGQCWTLHNASDAMWRIYSPNKDGLRIRTTPRRLLQGLYDANPELAHTKCCLGKVEYLTEKKLIEYADSIFDDSGISVENIFRSLLVKRTPFIHENEVRLLFDSWAENTPENMYRYKINPHEMICQIMIDPRKSYSEFKTIQTTIQRAIGFKKDIKRSMLYTLPKQKVLDVTNMLHDKK